MVDDSTLYSSVLASFNFKSRPVLLVPCLDFQHLKLLCIGLKNDYYGLYILDTMHGVIAILP